MHNHAKNHALLYRGAAPDFAPNYDVVPVILDAGYLHQMSFGIGDARMTDEIRSDDIKRFAEEIGIRRLTPAMARRLAEIVDGITARISDMSGPDRELLGNAMAEQCKWLAHALPSTTTVPARDLVVIQRP